MAKNGDGTARVPSKLVTWEHRLVELNLPSHEAGARRKLWSFLQHVAARKSTCKAMF